MSDCCNLVLLINILFHQQKKQKKTVSAFRISVGAHIFWASNRFENQHTTQHVQTQSLCIPGDLLLAQQMSVCGSGLIYCQSCPVCPLTAMFMMYYPLLFCRFSKSKCKLWHFLEEKITWENKMINYAKHRPSCFWGLGVGWCVQLSDLWISSCLLCSQGQEVTKEVVQLGRGLNLPGASSFLRAARPTSQAECRGRDVGNIIYGLCWYDEPWTITKLVAHVWMQRTSLSSPGIFCLQGATNAKHFL